MKGKEKVSGNILTRIENDQRIDFRHDEKDLTALVTVHTDAFTLREDYMAIIDVIFAVLEIDLPQIPKEYI